MNNIVLEKRQDILNNNDSAQIQLESILERLSGDTNIELLDFNEAFHGNLDFSILGEYGFHHVKTILFGTQGEITSITNLPNTLEKLHINNQYLVELSDLPKNLVELECRDNYLSHIDVSYLKKLVILNVSNNKLEKLEKLPETLEELYCENNQISQLILKNNLMLRILHCSNNKTIIVDGLPPSLVDFKCENNPYIEQNNILEIHGGGSPIDIDRVSRKIDYYEAIIEYFKLKNKYESGFKEDRRKAYMRAKEQGFGKKARANKVSKIRPKCVSCGNYGGTIFKMDADNYFATCGAKSPDCTLNIHLHRGFCVSTNEYSRYKRFVNEIKESVIVEKLSSIFKYKSESAAIDAFNNLIEEYNEYLKEYNDIKVSYEKLMLDPDREKLIPRKTAQIYGLISAIKTIMKQYEEEENPILLQTAVKMQAEELIPEIHNLRKLKYEVMEMNADNTLTQMYSALSKQSHYGEHLPRVVKWSV